MQKLFFSIILLFGVIGVFYYISKINVSSTKENYNKVLNISDEEGNVKSSFKIDLVDNPIKRELGLSYRKSMCVDCGMLFIFPKEDFYSFWMKDMNFDIDIIFIDSDKKVVNIFSDVKKAGYNKNEPGKSEEISNTYSAMYVLELNAGKSSEKNIKIGDTISF